MDLLALVDQVRTVLQTKRRVSYRMLKRQFGLDDETLDDLKYELIEVDEVATDKDGKMLVWTGGELPYEARSPSAPPITSAPSGTPVSSQPEASLADRRQLTVMFCDLVGSTPMSAQLDPEDYRDIMQAYQEMCGQVLARFTGHIARYEGDGILVYFGYPQAQEDAAAQAVRAGLQIIAGLPDLNARFQPRFPLLQERPLQVRIGLHTGLVVVGEMGSEQYRIDIAVGETPNMAARIQGQAGPNELVISTATYRLVEGMFECEDLGSHDLKGLAIPQTIYQVTGEGNAQSRFEAAVRRGLTPLVGRDHELQFLWQRWERACGGEGQAILVSGEPGIGKSRLVQELKEQTRHEEAMQIEFRCSSYYQNSALYPVIEYLQRRLQFQPNDTKDVKLEKLQRTFGAYQFLQDDTVPLLATLLSLPQPVSVSPLTYNPQKQKKRTLETLVRWLLEEAERTAVSCVWEDLHWADPSTLDLLSLFLEQIPTARMFVLLVFRPEFTPPWEVRSSLSQLSLSRLDSSQVAGIAVHVTGGRNLPAEIVEEITKKTDGIPLFVEELTKMVVESGMIQPVNDHYELRDRVSSLTIPSTLRDSLMARLDRLPAAKEIAQLGAVIGREFSYTLLQAVSSRDEETLQQGLKCLVEAELIYQRGFLPEVQYVFKHALIQDTAYQSLLKSMRQQMHHRIAQVLEERFVETLETQPELVARHYTEAGRSQQAIPYWQRAGQRALQRSANAEAESHLTTGLALLNTLPDSPERAQYELSLHLMLGPVLMATKNIAAEEVSRVYTRAYELCRQLGETPELFSALWGLWRFRSVRAHHATAHELAEQLLRLAQSVQDPDLVLEAEWAFGGTLFFLGKLTTAREHLAQSLALYDSQQHHAHVFQYGSDPGVAGRCFKAATLWHLGYPGQALQEIHTGLRLAQDVVHPFSLVYAFSYSAWVHYLRREVSAVHTQTAAAIHLSTEQQFPFWVTWNSILQGWALALQGKDTVGVSQLRENLAAYQAMGAEGGVTWFLTMLTEAYSISGQPEDALQALAEALEAVETREERVYEAELYRLKGELLLMRENQKPKDKEADECFQRALNIARHQQAKSLELRAAMSLARLWQQHGKQTEARDLLAPVYNWFTEGFDTKDLQEAKALLSELS